jgi:hypothetical protein
LPPALKAFVARATFPESERQVMTSPKPNLLPDKVRLRSREAEAIRELARALATIRLDCEPRRLQLVVYAEKIEQLAEEAIELIAEAHH